MVMNKQQDLSAALTEAGVNNTVKMIPIPLAIGKFMLRLQNLADPFDSDSKTQHVNKTMVIEALWKSANTPDAVMKQYTVTEKSITGNIDVKEMNDRRLQWKTVDDDKLVKKDLSFDDGDMVTLEPLRIRTFMIEFDM